VRIQYIHLRQSTFGEDTSITNCSEARKVKVPSPPEEFIMDQEKDSSKKLDLQCFQISGIKVRKRTTGSLDGKAPIINKKQWLITKAKEAIQ